jgi:hypothetical protein
MTFPMRGKLAALSMLTLVLTQCAGPEDTMSGAPDTPWAEAAFDVLSAQVQGDILVTVVRYGGGCGPHRFELEAAGPLLKSLPPKQPVRWVHRSPGDPCRALVLDTLRADLKDFRGTPHGTTVLHLEGWDETLIYTYR